MLFFGCGRDGSILGGFLSRYRTWNGCDCKYGAVPHCVGHLTDSLVFVLILCLECCTCTKSGIPRHLEPTLSYHCDCTEWPNPFLEHHVICRCCVTSYETAHPGTVRSTATIQVEMTRMEPPREQISSFSLLFLYPRLVSINGVQTFLMGYQSAKPFSSTLHPILCLFFVPL